MAIKLKIENGLYDQLQECADLAGYSSAEELAIHVLEREVEKILGDDEELDEEKALERLRGLGYMA